MLKNENNTSLIDKILLQIDSSLQTIFAYPATTRTIDFSDNIEQASLSFEQKKQSAETVQLDGLISELDCSTLWFVCVLVPSQRF